MLLPLLAITVVIGLYMAWNIGANDAANSMATSYGSGALTLKQIIILAGILEFTGAVFFGSRVTNTIAKNIIPVSILDAHLVSIGALAAILSAGIWITIATYYSLPVSTTHSAVGAMVGFGFGLMATGTITLSQIQWAVLEKIVLSWIISPIVGAIMAFVIFTLIRIILIERSSDVMRLERMFAILQIGTAAYVAFAHGSNDVANATGPIAAALGYLGKETPLWVLALGGLGIAVGIATWGYKVIETVGKRITDLTPTRGFSAEFSAATTVIVASYLGLPISTTHTLVGSVIGVGMAGGLAAVNLNIIRKIVASWILTVPIAAGISAGLYVLMRVVI